MRSYFIFDFISLRIVRFAIVRIVFHTSSRQFFSAGFGRDYDQNARNARNETENDFILYFMESAKRSSQNKNKEKVVRICGM